MTQLEEGRLGIRPWWCHEALREDFPKARVRQIEAGPLCMYTETVRRYAIFDSEKRLGAQPLPSHLAVFDYQTARCVDAMNGFFNEPEKRGEPEEEEEEEEDEEGRVVLPAIT